MLWWTHTRETQMFVVSYVYGYFATISILGSPRVAKLANRACRVLFPFARKRQLRDGSWEIF